MDKDRFDFEQDIFDCWHIIDDLKQLYSMVCENDDTSKDDIANVLGGMFTLYDDRFRQLMDAFEHLIKVDGLSAPESVDNLSRYDRLSTEKFNELRTMSETYKKR